MMRARALLATLVVLAMASGRLHDAAADDRAELDAIADRVTGLDFDEARDALAKLDGREPRVAFERARLALYESDCDGAAAILGRQDVSRTEAGQTLGDIARGCARVTAAINVLRDDAHAVEVRYQDDGDVALQPYIVETVVRARDVLTADLGVSWPKPTRITVVRDLLSLSAMTGLPREAAQTTGTVAVAKWGRVTLLSPRATRHGYAWRDTLNHELSHLAVTRATLDHAPLWLQEGVAKREETRWRAPGPFDDRPSAESIVARGMQLKLDLPLDKLGPSIAMLPSADAAMVAFAEVTSFVRFYAADAGDRALPRLLDALRVQPEVDEALRRASGHDLKAWDARWRAHLASTSHDPLPPGFGLGPGASIGHEVRDRVRLSELLLGRGHAQQAITQLDRVHDAQVEHDASLRHLRGLALEATSRGEPAAVALKVDAVLGEPRDVASAYGPWWALRGRMTRARGVPGGADAADGYFLDALAEDPLDVEVACQSLDPAASPRAPRLSPDPAFAPVPPLGPRPPSTHPQGSASVGDDAVRALCEAARARREPPPGRD